MEGAPDRTMGAAGAREMSRPDILRARAAGPLFAAALAVWGLHGCTEVLSLDDFRASGGGAAGEAPDGSSDVAGEEPACGPGTTDCSGACVDTSGDVNHCGGCDHACGGANAHCNAGSCECLPTCVSPNGCGADGCDGACGSCEPGWSCWQGYCVKEWPTTGAWSCYEKCGGNTAANPELSCVGSAQGSCDVHEAMCYCWCSVPGTCSL